MVALHIHHLADPDTVAGRDTHRPAAADGRTPAVEAAVRSHPVAEAAVRNLVAVVDRNLLAAVPVDGIHVGPAEVGRNPPAAVAVVAHSRLARRRIGLGQPAGRRRQLHPPCRTRGR